MLDIGIRGNIPRKFGLLKDKNESKDRPLSHMKGYSSTGRPFFCVNSGSAYDGVSCTAKSVTLTGGKLMARKHGEKTPELLSKASLPLLLHDRHHV